MIDSYLILLFLFLINIFRQKQIISLLKIMLIRSNFYFYFFKKEKHGRKHPHPKYIFNVYSPDIDLHSNEQDDRPINLIIYPPFKILAPRVHYPKNNL